MKSVHSGRLERWLGVEVVERASGLMRGWYGDPIHLLDVPGSVRVCADGDFVGDFERGYFASAKDSLRDFWKRAGRVQHGQVGLGFANVAAVLLGLNDGHTQALKYGKTASYVATSGIAATGWYIAGVPAAGSAGGAAGAGTVHVSTDTGAMPYNNPNSGTMHLVGADFGFSGTATMQSVLLYDRLFAVAKTMNSTGTEAVTGVPTRYQSTTATDADYIGNNFGFIEVSSLLANTAHNWTTCLYTDQGGASSTLPSFAGVAAAVANRLDHPTNTWFVPLAAGDSGIGAWTQMQCDALVATGGIVFCIGHPLGFMANTIPGLFPHDWITKRNQAPRVFDNACLATLSVAPQGTGTTPSGTIYLTNAP